MTGNIGVIILTMGGLILSIFALVVTAHSVGFWVIAGLLCVVWGSILLNIDGGK